MWFICSPRDRIIEVRIYTFWICPLLRILSITYEIIRKSIALQMRGVILKLVASLIEFKVPIHLRSRPMVFENSSF